MKITVLLSVLALISLTACSTNRHATPRKNAAKKDTPESVIVTYYVLAGDEDDLQNLLTRAWNIYQKEHLVEDKPHLVLRQKEADGQTRIVEIFTWVSHEAPKYVPDSVTALWKQMGALCEPRHGYAGLDGGEVTILNPDAERSKR